MQAELEAKIKFIAETEDMKVQFKRDVEELQMELAKLRIPLSSKTIEGDLGDYYKEQKKQKSVAGSLGGAAEAGAVGGGVAAGILILADAIKEATRQSKILSMIQETVGKALGLLVDVILIPFLPIIVWGLVNLFNAIMSFKNWWDKGFEGIFALGVTLSAGFDEFQKQVFGFLKWLFMDNMGMKLNADGTINLKATLGDSLQWIYDNIWKPFKKQWDLDFNIVAKTVSEFLDWLWGAAKTEYSILKMALFTTLDTFWTWFWKWKESPIPVTLQLFADLKNIPEWVKNAIMKDFSFPGIEPGNVVGQKGGGSQPQGGFVDKTPRSYPAGSYESGQPAKSTPTTVNASFNIQVKGTTVEEIKVIAKEVAKAETRTWRIENQTA